MEGREASGSVRALARWPIKSCAGETVQAVSLDVGGITGDRRHTVVDLATGDTLTAAETPRLLRWTAAAGVLRDPLGQEWAPSDAATCRALGADLGRTVTLRSHQKGQQYHAGTVLVTVESSLRALERGLAGPVDLRRFRPNLHLELDSEPFAELGWTGRELRVGDAVLEFLHPCERCVIAARDPDTGEKWPELIRHLHRRHDLCFGIFAAPRIGGVLATDDRVEVSAPKARSPV
jgi:uncharacterized protein YcbX